MMFKVGDLVSILTEHLLDEHVSMMDMLAYNVRPRIYGVVRDESTDYGCFVSWSMDQMFNLEMDQDIHTNYERQGNGSLTLVRSKFDADVGDDTYVETFFEHNGDRGWKESAWNTQHHCTYCGEDPGSRTCRRMNLRTQMAMMQLYFDLNSVQNDHLTNKQKRYQCYRWYITVVFGRLGAGVRRRVDTCVETEIGHHFPNPDGEPRIGFRSS